MSETRSVISLLAVWLIVDFVNELIYSDVLEYELFNASSTIFSSNSVDILALAFNPNSCGNGENVFLQDLHVT